MPIVPELEGAKLAKAIAAAKAEGFKAGAAGVKAGAAKSAFVQTAAVKATAAKTTTSVKAAAVKTTAAKVVAAKTAAPGILSGGASACHLGLGLGLGVWGPVMAIAALCAATGACAYWCARQSQIRRTCESEG